MMSTITRSSRADILIFRTCILFVLFCISPASPAFSALNWLPTNGPYGGSVTSIAISSSEAVYAGTAGAGVFRSFGGEEWAWKTNGMSDVTASINDLAVISGGTFETDMVFAATNKIGVWKSVNGGERWYDASSGLNDGAVSRIAIDPTTHYLYAATATAGLKLSRNAKERDLSVITTWETLGLGPTFEPNCIAIVTYESAGSVISAVYVGTLHKGIYKTTDGGATFSNVTAGYASLEGIAVTSIGVCFSSPEVIYATRSANPGIHKSVNGGLTWFPVGAFGHYTEIWGDLTVDRTSPDTVYFGNSAAFQWSGVYKSTNGGGWWSALMLNGHCQTEECYRVLIDPNDSSIIYAINARSGVFRSTDSGATWQMKNKGMNGIYLTSLLVTTGESGSVIYAGSASLNSGLGSCGLFRTTDEGTTWITVNNGLIRYDQSTCLAASPESGSVVYAGFENSFYPARRIFRTRDGGNSWQLLPLTLDGGVKSIAVDPNDPRRIYAAGAYGTTNLFISSDEGNSWSAYDVNIDDSAVIFGLDASKSSIGSVFHAGGSKDGRYMRFYRLRSGDPSWEAVNGNLVDWMYDTDFAPDYSSTETIFMGGSSYLLWKKKLLTNTWEAVQNMGDWASEVETDPNNPSKIYVSLRNQESIWALDNGGSSKQMEMSGLPNMVFGTFNAPYSVPLKVDPYTSKLYAGIPTRGVWRAMTVASARPNPPTNFSGTARTSTSINWSWTDNSYNEQGCRIYDNNGNLKQTLVGTDVTSYEETGLSTNESCSRNVRTYNGAGESDPPYSSDTVYTLAVIPGTPEASTIRRDGITVTWESCGNPSYTSYEVWNSTVEAGSFFPAYWRSAGFSSTTEFTDNGLSPESTYWYKVRALNGDGITTEFGLAKSFETLPPNPSQDIYPPRITDVRFDGRRFFENDIVYRMPRVSALITDYASHEPDLPPNVTPEGVDRASVKIRFGDYVFENLPGSAFTTINATMERVSYQIPSYLGSSAYLCSIEASDRAYPWFNKGSWRGALTVKGERVNIVGNIVAYPMPFKPLTDKEVTMSYSLSTNANVTIYMYDVSGHIVMTRKFSSGGNGGKAGYNQFTWDGVTDFRKVAGNGIYVYKLISGGRMIGTGKLVVLD